MLKKQIAILVALIMTVTCFVPCYAMAMESNQGTNAVKAVDQVSDSADKAKEKKKTVTVSKPVNVKANGISQSKIKVTWKRVSGADGYKVYRYNADKNKYILQKTLKGSKSCSYVNKNIPPRKKKAYRVRAYKKVDGRTYLSTRSSKAMGTTKAKTMVVVASAYHMGTTTATGTRVHKGVMAVDPRTIKFGTKVYVPGYGYARAEDTGGAIKGNRIDLYMTSTKAALKWGRRKVTITIY